MMQLASGHTMINMLLSLFCVGRLPFEVDMNSNLESVLHQEKQHLSSESGSDV